MLTRRNWMLGSLSAVTVRAVLATDSWNKKPSDWSPKDVTNVLNKSPWAKVAKVEFRVGDLGKGEHQPGGIPPGPPPSGVDNNHTNGGTRNETGGNPIGGAPVGRGGIPADASDLPKFQAVVRWESAAPMRLARKSEDAATLNRYVISVTGFPRMPVKAAAGDNGEDIRAYTRLERGGKPALRPVGVEIRKGGVLEFTFDGSAHPITDEDHDVLFTVSTGSLEARVRFYPRDMIFEGHMALY